MKTFNAKNERTKHAYLAFRKDARGYSEASLEATAKALNRFEAFNKFRDFSLFRSEQATSFKNYLLELNGARTGKRLSLSTINSTLGALRAFTFWLSQQRGYRSKFSYSDSEYFRMSRKDARIATARRMPLYPTEAQLVQAVSAMPADTEVGRRDRAILAFICLTGMRNSAAISVQLGDIDLQAEYVTQDARHVRTKFSKTMLAGYFPVDPRFAEIVADWVTFLRHEKGFESSGPLFPATDTCGRGWTNTTLHLSRRSWKSTGPLRRIFRDAFERVGLPYFNPHSIRHTLEFMREEKTLTDAERKAWSQNLGHEHVSTSLDAYAPMDAARQLAIMKSLRIRKPEEKNNGDIVQRVLDALQDPRITAELKLRESRDAKK